MTGNNHNKDKAFRMASNIEIKARVSDPEAMEKNIRAVCGAPAAVMAQKDTFYRTKSGRLKIREMEDVAEIIYYWRSDRQGPKQSKYYRKSLPWPGLIRRVLAVFPGVRGVVEKTRVLYFSGRTRVHFDHVEHLGCFVELEVVLDEADTAADGTDEADRLMLALGIESASLISCAYMDMLDDSAHTAAP